MIFILYSIAGIDSELMGRCPKTDSIWGAQLGAWLVISFLLVFMVSLQSMSYLPGIETNLPARIVIAVLIASTIFLFDRALYQSDWFCHGYFQRNGLPQAGDKSTDRKLARIVVRLLISCLVAYGLSTFLELAIFSGSIMDRLEQAHRAANAPSIGKLEQYRKDQEAEVAHQRSTLDAAHDEVGAINRELREGVVLHFDAPFQDVESQKTGLLSAERQINAEIAARRSEISERKLEVVAETEGTQPDRRYPGQFSGVASCGPRCRSAKKLIDLYQADLVSLEQKLSSTRGDLARFEAERSELLEEAKAIVLARRTELERRRREIASEIEQKQSALSVFEMTLADRMRAFDEEIKRSPEYIELRADPLIRLRALEQLKADPVYGGVITAYSWAVKLFIIFLEIVPVLGKIFFAPPSAYAIHVQKKIERHQKLDLASNHLETPQVWAELREQGVSGSERKPNLSTRRRHLTVLQELGLRRSQ